MRCFRCGRKGHFATTCFARSHVNGESLTSEDDDDDDNSSESGYSSCDPEPRTKRARYARATHGGVYVLQYNRDMYYVGKSSDVGQRIQQHERGEGAACLDGSTTPLHAVPPLTCGDAGDLEAWERNETLERMRRFGIGKVRGWLFVSKQLSMAQGAEAFRQVCERFDLCRRCGRESHLANTCVARAAVDWTNGFVSLA